MKDSSMQEKMRAKIVELVENPDGIYAVCQTNPDAAANLRQLIVLKIGGKLCPPPPVEATGQIFEITIQKYRQASPGHFIRTPEIVCWQAWYQNKSATQIVEISSRDTADDTAARIRGAEAT